MSEHIKLSAVEDRFRDLEYPVTRVDAAAEFDGVIVQFADGEQNLGLLLSECDGDAFTDADELYTALQNVLPTEALGEPGQSEGDA